MQRTRNVSDIGLKIRKEPLADQVVISPSPVGRQVRFSESLHRNRLLGLDFRKVDHCGMHGKFLLKEVMIGE